MTAAKKRKVDACTVSDSRQPTAWEHNEPQRGHRKEFCNSPSIMHDRPSSSQDIPSHAGEGLRDHCQRNFTSAKPMPCEPFILEVCAGSARVTACLQAVGLHASFGVDHKKQKNSGRVLVADLTTKEGQALCWSWIKSPSCMGIFCAPPCGTCSRARGIPITLPNGQKVAGPQPLRSETMPDGVHHMSWLNRRRVQSANTLYAFITKIALYCLKLNLIVIIENPRSSLHWRASFYAPLRRLLRYTAHQACAYGSERPKWTVLAHNTQSLLALCRLCPGTSSTHKHKPWGVVEKLNNTKQFSTAEETAYPLPLAYAIAFGIAQELMLLGWQPPPWQLTPPDQVSFHYLRSIVGVQPKASKLPPLLSEFSHIVRVTIPADGCPIAVGQKLQSPWNAIPAGAKLLRRPPLRLNGGNSVVDDKFGRPSLGGNVVVDNCDFSNLVPSEPAGPSLNISPPDVGPTKPDVGCSDHDGTDQVAHFGVYRTCDQFVKDAVSAGHPVGGVSRLPNPLPEVVMHVPSTPVHVLAKQRLATLQFWLDRGRQLAGEESQLHSGLPSALRGILAPKRLLLWKEMMEYYHYPDVAVFDEVVHGIDLAGPAPVVPFFDPCFRPAKVSTSELAQTAAAARTSLLATVGPSGDDDPDRVVFSKTLEELDCGWLDGPYEPRDLQDDAVVSRRFGIRQSSGEGSKVRLIDDFSGSGVNDTVQVESAVKLHTLDVAAALCMELLRVDGSRQWLGKTMDLSAAYRQLGISPGSRWVSYIAVYDPNDCKAKIFAMRALPFGASRSVYSFLRVSHSLWWLGCKALRLVWSNFFDDFITFARAVESESVAIAALQFFRLLGWAVSTGDKDLPFAEKFKALGVEIDCAAWQAGKVYFANTEKRVKELAETIDDVLRTGRLTKQAALVLRGRMQFAKAQLWGRAARLCLNAVTAHAYSALGDTIGEHTASLLRVFRGHLSSARPREITVHWNVPYFLFTDASFSPEDASWPGGLGGVLVNSKGEQVSAFSFMLRPEDLAALGYPEKSTVIFEAELLALLVSFMLWKKFLKGHPCVAYVDNNSTRDVCISGSARTYPGSGLVAQVLAVEDSQGILPWFARVPSESNIADGPSRGSSDGVNAKFLSHLLVGVTVAKCLQKLSSHSG